MTAVLGGCKMTDDMENHGVVYALSPTGFRIRHESNQRAKEDAQSVKRAQEADAAEKQRRSSLPNSSFDDRWPDLANQEFRKLNTWEWNCKVVAKVSSQNSDASAIGLGSYEPYTTGRGFQMRIQNDEAVDLQLTLAGIYVGEKFPVVRANSAETFRGIGDVRVENLKPVAPEGWTSFNNRSMLNVYWKSDTSAKEEFFRPPDDSAKSGHGYATWVTFWNRRTEPVVVDFVITDPSVNGMPDPSRHIGGGSITLLGGQTKTVGRIAPQKTGWQIFTVGKASLLE